MISTRAITLPMSYFEPSLSHFEVESTRFKWDRSNPPLIGLILQTIGYYHIDLVRPFDLRCKFLQDQGQGMKEKLAQQQPD